MSTHMEHCVNVYEFVHKTERRQSTDEDRGGAGGGLAREASDLAEGAGALHEAAVPTSPPPPWRVFCVHRPEDRSFLTKTIVHWCVRECLFRGQKKNWYSRRRAARSFANGLT